MGRESWDVRRGQSRPDSGVQGITLRPGAMTRSLVYAVVGCIALADAFRPVAAKVGEAPPNNNSLEQTVAPKLIGPFGVRQAYFERSADWPQPACTAPQVDPAAKSDPGSAGETVPVRPDPNCPPTRPDYPRTAFAYEHEGTVRLLFIVNENGLPDMIAVDRSSGFLELDESALRAAREWRFLPARNRGVPVAAWHLLNIRFRLEDWPSD